MAPVRPNVISNQDNPPPGGYPKVNLLYAFERGATWIARTSAGFDRFHRCVVSLKLFMSTSLTRWIPREVLGPEVQLEAWYGRAWLLRLSTGLYRFVETHLVYYPFLFSKSNYFHHWQMARTNRKFRYVKKETRDARLGILPYLLVKKFYDILRVHLATIFFRKAW